MKVNFDNPIDGGDEYFSCFEDGHNKILNAKWSIILKWSILKHSWWERIKIWWEYKRKK